MIEEGYCNAHCLSSKSIPLQNQWKINGVARQGSTRSVYARGQSAISLGDRHERGDWIGLWDDPYGTRRVEFEAIRKSRLDRGGRREEIFSD
jgi:hypothetical protein